MRVINKVILESEEHLLLGECHDMLLKLLSLMEKNGLEGTEEYEEVRTATYYLETVDEITVED